MGLESEEDCYVCRCSSHCSWVPPRPRRRLPLNRRCNLGPSPSSRRASARWSAPNWMAASLSVWAFRMHDHQSARCAGVRRPTLRRSLRASTRRASGQWVAISARMPMLLWSAQAARNTIRRVCEFARLPLFVSTLPRLGSAQSAHLGRGTGHPPQATSQSLGFLPDARCAPTSPAHVFVADRSSPVSAHGQAELPSERRAAAQCVRHGRGLPHPKRVVPAVFGVLVTVLVTPTGRAASFQHGRCGKTCRPAGRPFGRSRRQWHWRADVDVFLRWRVRAGRDQHLQRLDACCSQRRSGRERQLPSGPVRLPLRRAFPAPRPCRWLGAFCR